MEEQNQLLEKNRTCTYRCEQGARWVLMGERWGSRRAAVNRMGQAWGDTCQCDRRSYSRDQWQWLQTRKGFCDL
jgi:hypothetical protein